MKETEVYNDEISLIDLAKVLIRRKKTVYLIFSIIVILAMASALLSPKNFSYTTTIEIGQRIENGQVKLIDEPATLLVKINKTYIPLAQQLYLEQNPDHKNVLKIKTEVPKKSKIIVL